MKKTEVFPPPVPPAYKKGIGHARPVGTWVTGENGYRLCGMPDHKGHIFVITSKPKKALYSNAGYQQDVACLECDWQFHAIDGEFLQIKLRGDSLAKAIRRLEKEVSTKKKTLDIAKGKEYE